MIEPTKPPAAFGKTTFCSAGSGAGAEELEVCEASCRRGIANGGGEAGQIERGTGVAVDNDPVSPSFHDVYVGELGADGNHPRVQNYDAREGGGFPEPPAPPLICAEESCKPAPTAPPQGAAPATPSFQGPGNQTHKPKPKKPKQSHKHKKKTNKHEKKGAKNR